MFITSPYAQPWPGPHMAWRKDTQAFRLRNGKGEGRCASTHFSVAICHKSSSVSLRCSWHYSGGTCDIEVDKEGDCGRVWECLEK